MTLDEVLEEIASHCLVNTSHDKYVESIMRLIRHRDFLLAALQRCREQRDSMVMAYHPEYRVSSEKQIERHDAEILKILEGK